MIKFYFQAVTSEGKKISGYITSDSKESAHLKLKNSGMSILTLEARQNKPARESKGKLFEFLGKNNQHKVVKGTIEAATKYDAYRKLSLEYKLEIQYIMNSELAAGQKEIIKTQGIPKDLADKLQKELKAIAKKEEKNKKKSKDDIRKQDLDRILKSNEKKAVFMRDKIDEIISQITPFLEENSDYIDANKRREIEDRIDLLSRLKYSNSITHLQNLTKKLLKELTSDKIFIQDANLPAEVLVEIEQRKQGMKSFSGGFEKAIFKGLTAIDINIGNIDIDQIKNSIQKVRVITPIRDTIAITFSSIAGLSIIVWLFITIYILLGSDFARNFLNSSLLWYITGFSIITTAAFYPIYFIKSFENTPKKKAILTLSTAVALVFFTIEFPVLFPWTH